MPTRRSSTGRRRPAGPPATARGRLRPVIASSWQRVADSGLTPEHALDDAALEAVDDGDRLTAAARPVLDELADCLAGQPIGILLADRVGRIVARRFGRHDVVALFDATGALTGRRLDERTGGTNAIGTAIAVRSGVAVDGAEHYLTQLRTVSCYGQPIFHPATGRLEGVLDITGPASLPGMTFAPLARLGARGIERRLLEGARAHDQELMAAFHAAAHRCDPGTVGTGTVGTGTVGTGTVGTGVVGLGEDLVLTNGTAAGLLESADHAALREFAARAGGRGPGGRLHLASGRRVDVRLLVSLDHGAVLAVTAAGPATIPIQAPTAAAGSGADPGAGAPPRRLGPLEQAEHDVIVATLAACAGNKVAAAARLGISRTTLYQRLRALRISG